MEAKARILRHRQTKGAETDRPGLKSPEPALYSTQIHKDRDTTRNLVPIHRPAGGTLFPRTPLCGLRPAGA